MVESFDDGMSEMGMRSCGDQLPFAPATRSSIRIKQAEKRHLADPSLACALLKMTPQGLVNDLETFRFLFEALCIRDLRIYAETFGADLYHYRDYTLCYIATFLLLWWMYNKTDAPRRRGLLFGVALIGIFLTRFFIEFVKVDQVAFEEGMSLNMGQWLSIPFILIGVVSVWYSFKRPMISEDNVKTSGKNGKK